MSNKYLVLAIAINESVLIFSVITIITKHIGKHWIMTAIVINTRTDVLIPAEEIKEQP